MDVPFLLAINIILLLSLISLIIIFLKDILDILNTSICDLRKFIGSNDGFFTIAFIFLFAIEQIILIGLIYYIKDNMTLLKLIVSIFSLFVVTTASLQKLLLETKRRYEKEQRGTVAEAKEVIRELLKRIS